MSFKASQHRSWQTISGTICSLESPYFSVYMALSGKLDLWILEPIKYAVAGGICPIMELKCRCFGTGCTVSMVMCTKICILILGSRLLARVEWKEGHNTLFWLKFAHDISAK